MIQIPGQHVPTIKNRSSKHLRVLTGQKPFLRCVSNAFLHSLGTKDPDVVKEINRRAKKASKRAV